VREQFAYHGGRGKTVRQKRSFRTVKHQGHQPEERRRKAQANLKRYLKRKRINRKEKRFSRIRAQVYRDEREEKERCGFGDRKVFDRI